jgi:hypothetical protein
VQIVVKFQYKTVLNTENNLLNLNVNIVVQQLNGFVGVIHIFVNLVIKNSVRAIMYQNILNKNYLLVLVKVNVL